jgi:hypothetical protein
VKEFVVYTAARLGLFLVSYAAVIGIYLLVSGEDSIPVLWPFLVAVVISAIASIYLLRGMRDRFALAVHQRAERAATRRRAVEAEQERMNTQHGSEDTRDEHAEGEQPGDDREG